MGQATIAPETVRPRAAAPPGGDQPRLLIGGAGIRDLLVDLGLGLEWVEASAAGRERIRSARYGTILIDLSCPETGIAELLREIRSQPREGHPYVILIGSRAELDRTDRGIALGADDVLERPLDPAAVAARLRVADRIGGLHQEISSQHRVLTETIEQLEDASERMRRELSAAAQVQQALLPSDTLRVPGVDVGWRLRPCAELAGDILNVLRVDEHHLAFYVLDVSGHGVSSALLSVQVSKLMSPLMSESGMLKQPLKQPPWYAVVEPVGVLRRLNDLFQMNGKTNQYFTIIYGLLHLESKRLQFATAGHPGPILCRSGAEPEQIYCRSHPVGFFSELHVEHHELTLSRGDRLWLYSDGVLDAAEAGGARSGLEALRSSIAQESTRPLKSAVGRVMEQVERWNLPALPEDDCTLLALEGGVEG